MAPWTIVGPAKDRPPATGPFPTPDQVELDDFFCNLGGVIAAWQAVESNLFMLFELIVKPRRPRSLRAAFYTARSFSGRLEMVTEAVEYGQLGDILTKDWAILRKRLHEKAKRRNSVAHSVMCFEPKAKPGKRLYLRKEMFHPGRPWVTKPPDQTNIISLSDLQAMYKIFCDLKRDTALYNCKFMEPED